eukprot:gene26761-biopygen17308
MSRGLCLWLDSPIPARF